LRQRLEALPDGDLTAELAIDGPPGDDPNSFPPIRLAVRATREGGRLHLDFAGSDAQHPHRAVNVPLSYTVADAIYAVQYLFMPDLPNIGPQFSPVRVSAPAGSILNAVPPVPVYARTRTGLHIGTLVHAALASVLPHEVQAASGHAVILTVVGRRDDGGFFKVSIMPKGGMGASGGRDGWSCTEFPTNSSMISTEVAERLCPVRIDRELRRDSGGAGRERGGLGQALTITSLAERPLIVAFRPNFVSHPPIGLLGGHPGAAARIEVDGHPPPENPITLPAGGSVRVWTAGGGGVGDPRERDDALVRRDVAFGLVSSEQALAIYGVHVD
jgi:N-methylhydantoinase B